MTKKPRRSAKPPTAPADAAAYVVVRTKEGIYWRRKRGTIKKAGLNSHFKKNVEATAIASPAAKRIFSALSPYLKKLDTGRFIAKVSSRLKKAMKKNGEMDFSFLDQYDLQPEYPLDNLLKENYFISVTNTEISIRIPIRKDSVKRLNRLVSDYYFEAILLRGDVSKDRGLKVESDISPLYGLNQNTKAECQLRVSLPVRSSRAARNDEPWMLMLKLSCHEGNEPAHHPKHYGMKVVRVGPHPLSPSP